MGVNFNFSLWDLIQPIICFRMKYFISKSKKHRLLSGNTATVGCPTLFKIHSVTNIYAIRGIQ